MAGRGFRVTIHLDVHAITCPGVWLCPHGNVRLKINCVGRSLESRPLPAVFPLLPRQRFILEKVLLGALSLSKLEESLREECLRAELIQYPGPCNRTVLLASFQRSLIDLLYPLPSHKRFLPAVNIDLLMEPTKHFPGIIVPKIEISSSTFIEDVSAIFASSKDDQHSFVKTEIIEPVVTLNSKHEERHREKNQSIRLIRQRPVCHGKETHNRQDAASKFHYSPIRSGSMQSLAEEICEESCCCYRRYIESEPGCTSHNMCSTCVKYHYYFKRPTERRNGKCGIFNVGGQNSTYKDN